MGANDVEIDTLTPDDIALLMMASIDFYLTHISHEARVAQCMRLKDMGFLTGTPRVGMAGESIWQATPAARALLAARQAWLAEAEDSEVTVGFEGPDDLDLRAVMETGTIRNLCDAADALVMADSGTSHGFVSDHCANAMRDIRKAMHIAMGAD